MIALVLLVAAAVIHGLVLYVLLTVKDHPGMWRTPYGR